MIVLMKIFIISRWNKMMMDGWMDEGDYPTFVFSCCCGLGPHGGANKHSVLPVEGLIDQRDSCQGHQVLGFSTTVALH